MSKTKDEQKLFDFITNAFEEDRYDEVVEFLEFFKDGKIEELHETVPVGYDIEGRIQKALDNILSFDEHSLVKWAAENSDVEGLLLLEKYLSKDSLLKAVTHNNFEALHLFLADSQIVNALRFYNKHAFQEGIKFFFKAYFKSDNAAIDIIINNSLKHYLSFGKTVTEDFKEELTILKEVSILSQQQLDEALSILGQDSSGFVPE